MNSIFPVWFYFVNSRTITKVQLKTWEVSRPSRVFGAFIPICPNLRRRIILTIIFSEYVSWHSPTIATDNQNPFSFEHSLMICSLEWYSSIVGASCQCQRRPVDAYYFQQRDRSLFVGRFGTFLFLQLYRLVTCRYWRTV